MHCVLDKFTRRPAPGCTVVQNLTRFRKGVLVGRPHPAHGARKPTVLRVHVTEDECRHPGQGAFDGTELPGLGDANWLRNVPEMLRPHVEVRLHVRVDNPQRPSRSALGELHVEPALRHEQVDSGGLEKRIEPGFGELPVAGAPGDGETGAEDGGHVGFPCRAEEVPPVRRECGGPHAVSTPDFLERDDVTCADEPTDDFLDGRICPRKTSGIVCADCEWVHYFWHAFCISVTNDVLTNDVSSVVSCGWRCGDGDVCCGGLRHRVRRFRRY